LNKWLKAVLLLSVDAIVASGCVAPTFYSNSVCSNVDLFGCRNTEKFDAPAEEEGDEDDEDDEEDFEGACSLEILHDPTGCANALRSRQFYQMEGCRDAANFYNHAVYMILWCWCRRRGGRWCGFVISVWSMY
jgi:hypothetical protein